jgi:PAS domain S-box-containing protein
VEGLGPSSPAELKLDGLTDAELDIRREQFRLFVDQSLDIISRHCPAGTYLYISPACTRILGYAPEEIVGRTPGELMHPEDRFIFEATRDAIAAGELPNPQYRLRRKDCSYAWVESNVQRVRPSDDRYEYEVVAVTRDISARKEIELALQESQRFFNSIFDSLTSHIAIIDERGVILEVNQAWRDFAVANGRAPGGSIGANYLEIAECAFGPSAEHAQEAAAGIRSVLTGGPYFELEYPCHAPTEQRWFLMRVSPFSGAGPVRAVIAHQNITSRVLAEQDLKYRLEIEEATSKVSSLFLEVSDRTLDQRIDGALRILGEATRMQRCFLFLGDYATQVFGNSHEWFAPGLAPLTTGLQDLKVEDFGWFAERLLHGEPMLINREDLPPEAASAREIMAANDLHSSAIVPLLRGSQLSGVLGVTSTDPKVVCSANDLAVLKVVSEIILGALLRQQEEQERLTLEAHLRQSQKLEAMGTLAGGIAHDFNNILYAIIGYAELVEQTLPPNSQAAQDQHEIINAANRAAGLVKQILTFSRMSTGDPIPMQVASIVKEVLNLIRATLPTTIEIRTSIDPDASAINADPIEMHQVLMNLCTNAAQAISDHGTLEIKVRNMEIAAEGLQAQLGHRPGRYVLLQVSDTGSGIPPEIVNKIFDPFFTTKEPGRGTGLGLSTVHGIITKMGGEITVYSEVGKGTTFNLYLPATDGEPEAATVQTLLSGNGERVLLVDDEPVLLRMSMQTLERLNYRVIPASGGMEAWAILEQDPMAVDLLVTDQTMPRMTGFELVQRARALRPDLPAIICTGFSHTLTAELAAQIPGLVVQYKPLTSRDLSLAIRRVLRGSANQG